MSIFHTLEISDVIRETEDAISVAFNVPNDLKDEYVFTQGQHLTLKTVVDGEEIRRSYSICSAVGDTKLQVAIKQIDGGKFSTFANQNFKMGQSLDVMIPQGRFSTPLAADNQKHYLAVAVGSGITPILSIVKTTLKTEPDSQVTLIYGNRTVASILFLEALEDLKNIYADRFNLIHILSREQQDSEIFNGRINAEKCKELFGGVLKATEFSDAFLCGPEQMTMDVKDFLSAKGMDSENIHFELFVTDAAIAASAAPAQDLHAEDAGPQHQVTVILDGQRTEVKMPEQGVSILDAALEVGMDLPFACKGGVCCTCRAKVIEGDVRMDVNYALEDEEVENGFILTCQAHPLTDKVVVDFDANG